ncbi:hypothetical protein [Nocardiopsis valliformis]|uniref:hypothetical protein n=1 Tax=Nocardiopsis valliformis TaxID=239974 RepID=UPI000347511F|nr:hypothetical protein [Nocardiopsis valliformis]
MTVTNTQPQAQQKTSAQTDVGDLLVAVEDIATLRSRGDQPSDGGTGRSDHNDSVR